MFFQVPHDRELCVKVQFDREYYVGVVQAVPVNVYDYYEPGELPQTEGTPATYFTGHRIVISIVSMHQFDLFFDLIRLLEPVPYLPRLAAHCVHQIFPSRLKACAILA